MDRVSAAEYNRLASLGAIQSGRAGRPLSLDVGRMARMAASGPEPIEPGKPRKNERPPVVGRVVVLPFALGFFLGVAVTMALVWAVIAS